MGLIRTLLAIAVVLSHTQGGGLVGGRNAVQMFYVISGFLISFVLIEVKSYPRISTFYINRYLRLFPLYVAVALLTLVMLMLRSGSPFWTTYHDAPWSARIFLFISNALIFGQDWVMFSGVRDGHLVLVKNFYVSDPMLYRGLLLPQAWTLGVELTFYAVAPLILGRRRLLLGLFIGSLFLRGVFVYLGFGLDDPWTYRFFPTELALFLAGSVAHQMLRPAYRRLESIQLGRLASSGTGLVLAMCLLYSLIPISDAIKTIILLGIFVLVVPLLFEFQKQSALDRYIGNLSYPIYINHMFVVMSLEWVLYKVHLENASVLASLSIAGSVGMAIVLEKLIGYPVERLRSFVRRSADKHLPILGTQTANDAPATVVRSATGGHAADTF